jgi:hypothetical protein
LSLVVGRIILDVFDRSAAGVVLLGSSAVLLEVDVKVSVVGLLAVTSLIEVNIFEVIDVVLELLLDLEVVLIAIGVCFG